MFDPQTIAASFFSKVKIIPASCLRVHAEVRELCKRNACGNYGKNWVCPPAVAPLDELKKRFEPFDHFLLVCGIYQVQDSFDWDGMMEGMGRFKRSLQALKKALEKDASPDELLVLGAGACSLCRTCTYMDGEPCRNPEDSIISMEACGIDVMELMKDQGMTYYNGPKTVTYVGGVFFRE
jgi:predicted metal-binding protein